MSEVLKTFDQTTCAGSHSAISLPGSGSGPTHCDRQDGQTTAQSGQEVARASLSAKQAGKMGLLTSGTFGQFSSVSSQSANLTSCLVNRLKEQSSTLGSTLYKMIWKVLVTPRGRSVPLLRASVPRTSGHDSIGSGQNNAQRATSVDAVLTVMAQDSSVVLTAALTGWVTPTTRDWKDTPGMATSAGKVVRLDQLPRQAAQRAGWPTPTAQDAVRGVKPPRPHDTGVPLTQRVGQMDFGRMPTGYPSETPNSALLNPALSRWLLGLPPMWDDAAPMEMR